FLQECLDDSTAEPCGRCDRCAGTWFPTEIPEESVGSAKDRLGAVGVPVEPRGQWPTGMPRLGVDVKGKIRPEEQAGVGRALARLSDLGWGQRLRAVLAAGGSRPDPDVPDDPELGPAMTPGQPVPEDVMRAVVQVLARWGRDQRPAALVAMRSRRRPAVVGSLAEQISQIGRLPLLGTLDLVHGGPVGEPGGNSAFRLANVWERIGVGPQLREALASARGPVLLVDDVVDS